MNGTGEGSGMAADASEARDLVAALVRAGTPDPSGPAGLMVPEGTAEEVIAVARRLALRAAPERRWRPKPEPVLLRVARALVVDEHPSAPEWPVAERQRLALWVAVLIEHRGEDGVQELIRELNEG
ncbi:hypothetical protein ACFRAR_17145 [Kitasatospora sp. NPDC056651]|uniref:hypothetical protein n=1 Tax=Kitasatospora sp. NPDC056651 TaxID=3345892 RepID=UPI00367B9F6C